MNNLRNEALIKQVGERIKELRKKKGLTMEALGRECELEKQHINRLEKGEVNVTISHLEAVAKGLEVSLSELLKGI
jgi:transcriptional regulator with XRE-family HTH domain